MSLLETADFELFARIVQQDSAIVLQPGKEYLVSARLAPVAARAGLPDLATLAARLRSRPSDPVRASVVEAMTTNETSFFRDIHPFEALGQHVIPAVTSVPRPDRTLNVWAAACSSGQEPYSIAMTAAETLPPGWQARITATDLSPAMVERTRAGRFSQLEVARGLSAPRLVAHFQRVGTEWEASAALRATINARTLNLAAPLPLMPRFDVVFLRNVLIYFDVPTKAAVLAAVRGVLRPGGYLFLGAAETTLGLDPGFERVALGRAMAYQLTTRGGRA
ncbi:CheR family methyltransferase [Phycicoccus avicenniae]|uniref:CheR family methyltransferase n=1 Tax=Phycicoccus avicenniae TaxID=2828860 RepID=UPI003D27455A